MGWIGIGIGIAAVLSGLIAVAIDQTRTSDKPTIRHAELAVEPEASILVDLNRATAAELEALPGIGPARAAAIIRTRETRPFRSLADLVERGVLRAGTIDRLRGVATVYRNAPGE